MRKSHSIDSLRRLINLFDQKNCLDNCKYIASFVGTTGTEEKLFIGLYETVDTIDDGDFKK